MLSPNSDSVSSYVYDHLPIYDSLDQTKKLELSCLYLILPFYYVQVCIEVRYR